MLLRELRARLFSAPKPNPSQARRLRRARLGLERLESRDNPTVTFNPIANMTEPAGMDLFVPLNATDSANQPITYSATSSNAGVTATLMPTGTFIDLKVSGTTGSGTAFSGDLVLELFNNVAPLATARITQLTNSGYYNGKTFYRVISDFVAQGGAAADGSGESSGLGVFQNETDPTIGFDSPALLALANSGPDTNDSQFFITDPKGLLSAEQTNLNYNYTIFGQLVSGSDILQDVLGTQVQANSTGEVSQPVNPITIVSATVISDNHDAVLRIHEASTFVGSSTINVTATSPDNSVQQPFTVNVDDQPPVLGTIPNQTTTMGTAVTFSVPATSSSGATLTYAVRDPNNFAAPPPNVTVSINQTTGRVTVTPVAGFTGTVEMLVGVRDQTDRSGTGVLETQSNYDTQVVTLTVTGNIELAAGSDDGIYSDDNVIVGDTPTISINANAGQTVTASVNGSGSFATTETTSGVYSFTLPAGTLQLGNNTISAVVTGSNPETLAPLTISYQPSQQSAYVVPGAIGSSQQVTFTLGAATAAYHSEIGLYVVDNLNGDVNGLAPTDPGYAKAALGRAQIIATRDQLSAGTTTTTTLTGGEIVGFYLIRDNTSQQFLAANPINQISASGTPIAFFSFEGANPDNIVHVAVNGDPATGIATYGWEDTANGGDFDYNDRIFSVAPAGTASTEAFAAPSAPAHDVTATFQLMGASKSQAKVASAASTTADGEIGYFLVSNAQGEVDGLNPGDSGYAQAALNASHVLFANGAAVSTSQTATFPGGSLIGYYFVKGGTAASVLSSNPTDSLSNGGPVAYFSFHAANPDSGTVHFSTADPEGVAETAPGAGQPTLIHAMGTAFGTTSNFDDVEFSMSFASTAADTPVVNSVVLSSTTPKTNDTLTATVADTDPAGATVNLTYIWLVNGAVVQQQTTTATTNSLDLSQAGNGDVGQVITVEVIPSNSTASGAKVTATATVAASPPVVGSVVLTPNPPATTDTVTATITTSDADNAPVTATYVWQVNGTTVQTTSDTSSATDQLVLSAHNVQAGDQVSVAVTPNVGTVSGTPVSQSVTVS